MKLSLCIGLWRALYLPHEKKDAQGHFELICSQFWMLYVLVEMKSCLLLKEFLLQKRGQFVSNF